MSRTLNDAEYVAALIDLLGRKLAASGELLPARAVAIRRGLLESTRVTDINASAKECGQNDLNHNCAGVKAYSLPRVSQSPIGRVTTADAAKELHLKTDSVRYLCREGRLDSVKDGRRHLITVESVQKWAHR